jgi:glucose/arabinose dehydrogenase
MIFLVAACGDAGRVPEESTFGSNPVLPEPNETLIPTVNIPSAKGWPADAKPTAASGLSVGGYATGLDHPPWLYVLPNGDVLVAETDGPPRPDDGRGVRGWIYQLVQRWVGAGVPSANRITLLRDADGEGVPRICSTFLQGLNSPFGMALIGHDLYVANTDRFCASAMPMTILKSVGLV